MKTKNNPIKFIGLIVVFALFIWLGNCSANKPPATVPPTESQGTAESQNPTEKPKLDDGSYMIQLKQQ